MTPKIYVCDIHILCQNFDIDPIDFMVVESGVHR